LGCGAGAFLYALRKLKLDLSCTGVDYSPNLLKIAKDALPDVSFVLSDLRHFDFSGLRYDHIILHSVVHYLSQDNVGKLLSRCFEHARRSVAVLDIPDAATMRESERQRQGNLPPGEYITKYRNLQHTYFQQSFFRDMLPSTGWTLNWSPLRMPNYANADFRMHAVFMKVV